KQKEMNLVEQRRDLQLQIDAHYAKPSMTTSERKHVDVLLSKVADIRRLEDRQARLDEVMHETRGEREAASPEYHAAKSNGAFARYIRNGEAAEAELRTYAALSTAGVTIPEGFASQYVEKLKSYSGIRQVANVITTSNGDSLKNPIASDLGVGERLNENDP